MPFTHKVIEDAWRRSGCRCECQRRNHGHAVPHKKVLDWEHRGREGKGKWQAYSISGEYKESVYDCLILCWDCYEAML